MNAVIDRPHTDATAVGLTPRSPFSSFPPVRVSYHLSRVVAPAHRISGAYEAHRAFWRAHGLTPETMGTAQPFRFRLEGAGTPGSFEQNGRLQRTPQLVTHLVQSKTKPDWSMVDDVDAVSKLVEFEVQDGDVFSFKIKAVVHVSCRVGNVPTGKSIKRAVTDPVEIEAWFHRRAAALGFDAIELAFDAPEASREHVGVKGVNGVKGVPSSRSNATSNHQGFSLNAVVFNGVLRVNDPNQFAQALLDGFGPKPALGFGMFSVIRA